MKPKAFGSDLNIPTKNDSQHLSSTSYNNSNINNIYSNSINTFYKGKSNDSNYDDYIEKLNALNNKTNTKIKNEELNFDKMKNLIVNDFDDTKKNYKGILYNPYEQLCGLSAVNNKFETETGKLNKQMNIINSNIKEKENYYKHVLGESKNEVKFQKTVNKKDHIKKLFSTLNFPQRDSCYNDDYNYNSDKKTTTIDHDFGNHYKKSFMKTYEENKIMHSIILRKFTEANKK